VVEVIHSPWVVLTMVGGGMPLKGAKVDLTVISSGDSPQLHAKGFMGRSRKWGYQKEIKK